MKILVTGGASGLGEAITRKLSENKENLIYFTYYKSIGNAQNILKEFSNTIAIQCDFTQSDSVANLLKKMQEEDIDALVNNAITDLTKDHFQKINPLSFLSSFEKNVLPVITITQRAISIFRGKKFGRIVTILTSGLINKPPTGWSEYVANKAYLNALCKSWATENIRFNITSNSISPSFMLTELTKSTDDRILEQMVENHPLKKLLSPKEVANSVKFLLESDGNINGVNLIINSGTDIL